MGGQGDVGAAPSSSGVCARIEAPKAPTGWGVGRGCPLITEGRVWGGGCALSAVCPIPRKKSIFRSQIGNFGANWVLFVHFT